MFIRDAWFFERGLRLSAAGLALVVVGAAQAQVSNVKSDIGYGNGEQGYTNTNPPISFAQQNQVQFLPKNSNPTRTINSPLTDLTFVNPANSHSGHVTASSGGTSFLSASSAEATVTTRGFARATTTTEDPDDVYSSIAAVQEDLFVHLDSPAQVTFSLLNSTQSSTIASEAPGATFGIDGTFAGSFLTPGDHTNSLLLSAGDHALFMEIFTDYYSVIGPADQQSSITGDFSIDVKAVPEPSTVAFVGLGALGLIGRRRRPR